MIKIRKIKDVKEFTIKRSKWARGGENGESALLNDQGNMCCLGHYSKACGFNNDDIQSLAEPKDLFYEKNSLGGAWLANYTGNDIEIISWESKLLNTKHELFYNSFKGSIINSDATWNLMSTNDSHDFEDEADREKEITNQFKKIGIKVKFVD